jgi:hypothetical protein
VFEFFPDAFAVDVRTATTPQHPIPDRRMRKSNSLHLIRGERCYRKTAGVQRGGIFRSLQVRCRQESSGRPKSS